MKCWRMHPTDQVRPPRANVLGVGVSAINMADALHLSERLLRERSKGYVCLTGVHGIMEAQRDDALRAILNRCVPLCPRRHADGLGWAVCRGIKTWDAFTDPTTCSKCASCRHGPAFATFCTEASRESPAQLKQQLERNGSCYRYCRDLHAAIPATHHSSEEGRMIDTINHASPDIIWVGLSTPKQERFMAQYADRLNASLMVGVGAAFDIHAGLLADAPWLGEALWLAVAGSFGQRATPALAALSHQQSKIPVGHRPSALGPQEV